MTTQTNQPRSAEDILGMSDEELMKAGPPPVVQPDDTNSEQNQGQENNEANEPNDPPDDDEPDDTGDAPDDKSKEDPAKKPDDAPNEDDPDEDGSKEKEEVKNPPKKDEPTEPKPDATKKKDPDPKQTETQPEALTADQQLAKILAPFKANGRDMKVENVDEAIALMQMGANYNKKMAGLKPSLKILKFLENNQLLDEEKLAFLVDVHKKDPAAINKLIKDSGIDVMELDASKADGYKRTTASVDDREIELDTVLKDLEDSPTYAKTLNVVTKEWDSSSKEQIAGRPQLLKVIDNHVQTGIYDLVSTEMIRQRALGTLDGVSDILAYQRIGDAMAAAGGFNHLGIEPQGKPAPKVPVVVPAKPKKQEDEVLNNKRRALSPTKAAVPAKVSEDYNPLGLSDAEFMKRANAKYQ